MYRSTSCLHFLDLTKHVPLLHRWFTPPRPPLLETADGSSTLSCPAQGADVLGGQLGSRRRDDELGVAAEDARPRPPERQDTAGGRRRSRRDSQLPHGQRARRHGHSVSAARDPVSQRDVRHVRRPVPGAALGLGGVGGGRRRRPGGRREVGRRQGWNQRRASVCFLLSHVPMTIIACCHLRLI